MKIGYARTSTIDQNLNLQIDALEQEGCLRIFTEQRSATKERPELNNLLNNLRDGDILVVWKLDRLGRSLSDLIRLLNTLKEKNVEFISIKDKVDTSTPSGRLFFNIFASLSEYERELIIERTTAGLEAARIRGRIGGRKSGLSPEAKQKAIVAKHLYCENQLSINQIMHTINIGKSTLYRYLRFMDVEICSYKKPISK